jgi:hypothetical protein
VDLLAAVAQLVVLVTVCLMVQQAVAVAVLLLLVVLGAQVQAEQVTEQLDQAAQ